MTLNTARKIETIFLWITGVIVIPFVFIGQIFDWMTKATQWIIDKRRDMCDYIGNKLMLHSDAVKNGKIKNPYCLRVYTAINAYEQLKEAEEKGIETNL